MAQRVSTDVPSPGEPQLPQTTTPGRSFGLPIFDILGLALLALSGATLLALLGLGPGVLSGGLAALLRRLFGVGALPVVVALMVAGVGLVRLPKSATIEVDAFPWPRLVAVEVLVLALFALVHLLLADGSGFELATRGGGGGYLGWALATLLASLFSREGAVVITALIALGTSASLFPVSLAGVQRRLEQIQQRLEAQREAWEADPAAAGPEAPPLPIARPSGLAGDALALWRRLRSAPKAVSPRPAPLPHSAPLTAARKAAPQYNLPPLDLLHGAEVSVVSPDDANRKAALIEETLAAFGVPAQVIEINQGPAVTQFGVRPGYIERKFSDGRVRRRKVKVSKITGLADDLALALAARSIRVEAPVPGRPFIGIEIPNSDTTVVTLKSILTSKEFRELRGTLRIALGRDVSGRAVAADLARMPHLLIAGATGSGKSVCINTIIASLLFNMGPDQLKLLMVDPKMVELIPYNGVPHLIAPVVTDVERVVGALTWAMNEMDRRYKRFSETGVRNVDGYNSWADGQGERRLPYIVIIIDELADLMMVAPDQVERIICRLAQMARATGMHLILATQRPSVDVVTGLIKANFPARIAFAVTSGIDSRVILDTTGAEALLGRGDMLYMAPESSKLQRIQGCFVSDPEINGLTNYWRLVVPEEAGDQDEAGAPWDEIVAQQALESEDELLPQAIEIIREAQWASTSFLQRKLRIGYSRAARLMDLLEERGWVSPADPENPSKSRAVYVDDEEAEEKDLDLEPADEDNLDE